MKKLIAHYIVLLVFLLPFNNLKAGTGDFELSVQNLSQTDTNKLEFDVYILDTDAANDFYLSTQQFGFLINSDIYTGGTLSVAIDNTNSDLGVFQVMYNTPQLATDASFPNQTLIKLAGEIAQTPLGKCTLISKSAPGTLITHFVITNTISFVTSSTPDMAFTSSTDVSPLYATSITTSNGSSISPLPVTSGANAIVNGNPILNPPPPLPTAYNVTGGGTYCQGDAGLPVGLDNSEIGVDYTLIKNSVDQVPTVAGTGSAISFGDQLFGTYTVKGTNASGTTTMTGNAVITETSPTIAPTANAGSGAGCSQITANWSASANATSYRLDVSMISNFSSYVSGYQDLDVGNVTTYDVSGLTPGTTYYYRVRANNICGTSASSLTITYSTLPATPAQPGAITGTTTQCPGLTGQIYSIGAVTDASTYTWSVPSGWSITSGQGSTSVTVTTGSSGQNGNISVTAGNDCGTSTASTLAVTVTAVPSTPGTISGTANQCPGLTGETYSINSVANATNYTWTVPTGWSITSGQGSTSVTVTTGSTGQDGDIAVTANNSCGTSSARTLAVTVLPGTPAQPGVISGTADQCPGLTGELYSISAVDDASTYTWSLPTGWSITSGQGTTTITVTTGTTGQDGNISVTAGNSCGTSSAKILAVTVLPGTPVQPGVITGTITQCPGLAGQIYSIDAVTDASAYTWTVPTGWSITSGQGSTSLTVTTGTTGQDGDITVTAGNSCGTSSATSIAVSVINTPATPGTISGTTAQCPGLVGQVYSIDAVTDASAYSWTVPTGWIITSGNGTTSVTVTTGSSGEDGDITVAAGNSCGTSAAKTLAVTVGSLSSVPSGVDITNNNTCSGVSKTLTVTGGSLGTGADWQWFTGSCGGTPAGTGSSIFVDTPAGSSTIYYVLADGSCNTTACASGTVEVTPVVGTPSTPTPSASTICQGTSSTLYSTSASDAISYNWSVTGAGNSISGTGTTAIVTWDPAFTGIATVSVTANGCSGPSPQASTTVTVLPTPTATISGTTSVCQDDASPQVTFTNPQDLPVTISYNINGTSQTPVDVAANSFTTVAASTAAEGTFDFNLSGVSYQSAPTCFNSISGKATITVNSLPTATLVSSDADNIFCAGTSVTFTAGGGTNYNFRVNGSNVQNSSSDTYTTSSITNGQVVDVIVTNANGCSATSSGIANTVNALPVPTLVSSDADNIFCEGTSVTFTAGGGTNYNFRVGGASVQNSSSDTYTTSSLTNGQSVDVIVTNLNGCSATSSTITNFVNPLPFMFVTKAPECSGDLTTYSLEVTVSSGVVNSTSGTETSLGSNVWRISGILSGVDVIVTVTGSNGCEYSIAVNAPNCDCPVIQAPVSGGDKSYCESGIVPTITATVLSGETVDWYDSSSGGTLLQSGSLSYTPSAGGVFYAEARDVATSCISSTRTPVIVTMYPLPVPSLVSSDADNSFCSGTSITFTAGGGTNYNFRIDDISVQNGISDTYETSSLTNGQQVDVIVTNSNGCTATSSKITNAVNPLPSPTLISSDGDNIFCTGTTVTFTAGGGTNYNFRIGGVSIQNGALNTYTTSSLTNGQVVDVIVTNSGGCSATSTEITNTVNALPAPTLVSSDADNSFCEGTSISFTAGGGVSYDFRVNGLSVQNGLSDIYTTSSLTNGQIVDVVVTNSNGCSVTSSQIINTVNALPPTVLLSSDSDNSFCEGTSVTFTAGGGINYNFRVNGSSVQNGSSSTYSSSLLTDGQTVDVIVTNSSGCTATSSGITNTVYSLPEPTLVSSDADNIFCAGTSITFTAGGGVNYDFRVGGSTVQSGSSNTYTTTTLTNGQNVNVIVTNSNGCISTSSTITNYVNPLPFIIVTDPPTCSEDLATYSLSVTVSSGVVNSTSGNVSVLSGNEWIIEEVPSGVNITVTVIDGSGCENSLGVTAPNCSCPAIDPPVSGGNKSYCESDVIPTLTASVPEGETIDWYTASYGGLLLKSGSLDYTPLSSGTIYGTYYAMARDTTTGCTSTTRTAILLTMHALPIPTLVSSDADNIICTGTNVTFTAGGGSIYNFRVDEESVQNGASNIYNTNSLVDGQVVDVVVTNTAGCSNTSSAITNTVKPLPSPTLTSSDDDNSFCAGTSVTFTAGGGVNYNFRVNEVSVQNGNSDTYTTSALTNGQVVDVIVTGTNGCTAISSGITNTVYALPIPTLISTDADSSFCVGTAITFTAGGGLNYNFRVNGTSVQDGISDQYLTDTLVNADVVDVIVTNSSGCVATSSGILNTVNDYPVANAGSGGDECDLDFRLNAVPSIGNGMWIKLSGPGTATFAPDENTDTATVTVSEYGTYVFEWIETNNDCSDNATVTVNFYEQPISNAGLDESLCGYDYQLKAIPSVGEGMWIKTDGLGNVVFTPDSSDYGATVTVSEFGQYTFMWTEVNGVCSNSSSVNITFFEAIPADAGEGGEVCGLSFGLNAIPSQGLGYWSKTSGEGNAIFDPDTTKFNAVVTVDQPGEYEFAWTEVLNTCESSDVINVLFRALPVISVGEDTVICKGNSIQLNAEGEVQGNTEIYIWAPDTSLNNSGINNPIATPSLPTYYKVTLTDEFGCVSLDSLLVDVWEKPVANAGLDTVLNYLFELQLNASELNDNETGIWSLILGSGEFENSSDTMTTVTNLALGQNIVMWTVSNGVCLPSNDYLTITVNDFEQLIPSLITPNGDNKNEYFVLRGIETLGKTELIIFNRWGAQVYKDEDYDNDWNGIDSNGNPLTDDTYFYVIKAENGKSISGYIVIRR